VAAVFWVGVAAAAVPRPAADPASVLEHVVPDSVRFDQEIANGNAIAMTQTNYGFYGNNFFRRDASFEYPAGRGYEHMVRGGLWVGGLATNEYGEFIGVTCGTVDARQGPNSTQASEFTPSGRDILKRSTLPTSPYYDPLRAVSELDFVCDFNDFSPVQVGALERHRPMQIEVRHETYQWNFAEFQNILFLHIRVTNRGPLLRNLWVGFFTELGSGCKKCYLDWPPGTGDLSGEGMWYKNKYVVFDDSLRLLREHYCQGLALPPADPESRCGFQHVPYWVGLRHLGTRGLAEDTTTRRLSFSIWPWDPDSPLRDEDHERYALMSTGLIQPIVGDTLLPGAAYPYGPVELFSVGPFPLVYRDSSITVDFAFVGGSGGVGGGDPRGIQLNSKFAQFAYDHDYTLPVPPPSPRFTVEAQDDSLSFYWDNSPEAACDVTSPDPRDFEGYRVYIGEDPDSLAMVAQFDVAGDTASFNTGFAEVRLDPPASFGEVACRYQVMGCPPSDTLLVCDTIRYQYRLSVRGLRNGFKYYCAVTAFDRGNSQIAPLESGRSQNMRVAVPGPQPGDRSESKPTVFPNPYRVEARWDRGTNARNHYLWFANLPERCTIRVFSLGGDLLFEREFDGAAYHGEGVRGIYDPAASPRKPTLSGTMFGWDLLTRHGQAIASGLYLYSVEDHTRGDKYHVGKFLVIKSDREKR
jgi:hypothetical protein